MTQDDAYEIAKKEVDSMEGSGVFSSEYYEAQIAFIMTDLMVGGRSSE